MRARDDPSRVQNLRKEYNGGAVVALDNCSMSVRRGEVVSIIGPSGSGKSTLLRCINQLEKASGGTVRVCGLDLIEGYKNGKPIYAPADVLREIRLKIGLVFQNFNLFPHMNVLRNITEAPVRVLKQSKAETEKKAMELLEKMGLADKAKAYPCELSGGQQQRVSIARALAKNPKILLCDEPTGALDYKTSKQILSLLHKTCRETGTTVVVITHNGALAAMADRIITMRSGKIIQIAVNDNPVPVEMLEW